MPKISRGRLSGFNGMNGHTAEELLAWADKFDAKILDPKNTDDPRYLKRWASKMRSLAAQKVRACEHKCHEREVKR